MDIIKFVFDIVLSICGITILGIAIWTFTILPHQQRKFRTYIQTQVMKDYGLELTDNQANSLIYFGFITSRTLLLSKTQLLTYELGDDRVNLSIVQPVGSDSVQLQAEDQPVATPHVTGIWRRDDAGNIINTPHR